MTIGALVGALIGGKLGLIGFRRAILLLNVMMVLATSLTMIKNLPAIVIGRVLKGLVAGSLQVISPSFIGDITPTRLRGSMGGIS